MDKTLIKDKAPGKLMLLGEYAVLEGASSLVAAVDRFCFVEIKKNGRSDFGLKALNLDMPELVFHLDENRNVEFRGNLSDQSSLKTGFLVDLIKSVVQRYEKNIPGAVITIDTHSFYRNGKKNKLGLGSSAAITVALIRAFNKYAGLELTDRDLFTDALEAHRTAQGELGSGADIAAGVFGEILRYRMGMDSPVDESNHPVKPLNWPKNLNMLTIWTGKPVSTRYMINKVDDFKTSGPEEYKRIMNRMSDLSEKGIKAFELNRAQDFLEVITPFYELELELGKRSGIEIVSEEHKHISDLVREAGGVYKPSGAGGGDIGVAFSSDETVHNRIEETIKESSYKVLELNILKSKISKTGMDEIW